MLFRGYEYAIIIFKRRYIKSFVIINKNSCSKSESEFDLYENGIRKEYSFIADDVFAKKRAEILRGFLGRDFIFLTEYFREKYEAPARKNLKRSISRLEGL